MITAYAPHNGKSAEEKLRFYNELDQCYRSLSANQGKLVLGDFNARLGQCQPGEELLLGDYSPGRPVTHGFEPCNRDLLLEFCESTGTLVANTFYDTPLEEKMTYAQPGAATSGVINETQYHLLDLILCDAAHLPRITEIRSLSRAHLASDHFLVRCATLWEAESRTCEQPRRRNWHSLHDITSVPRFSKLL